MLTLDKPRRLSAITSEKIVYLKEKLNHVGSAA